MQTDRRVARILGLRPRLDQAGSDAHLTITSTCLKLTSLDTGDVIASHDLPNISFASGGDAVRELIYSNSTRWTHKFSIWEELKLNSSRIRNLTLKLSHSFKVLITFPLSVWSFNYFAKVTVVEVRETVRKFCLRNGVEGVDYIAKLEIVFRGESPSGSCGNCLNNNLSLLCNLRQ